MNANIQSQEHGQTSRDGKDETDGNNAGDMTVGIRDGQIIDPAHFGMLKSIKHPFRLNPTKREAQNRAELSDGVC